MKKIIAVLLLAALLFAVCGCGDLTLTSSKESRDEPESYSSEDGEATQEDVFEEASESSSVIPETSSNESSSKVAESSSKKPVIIESSSKPVVENHEKDTSGTVYVTPTGKRYHLDPDCGGKNSRASTLNSARDMGLTPCKKCAQ